MFTSKMSIFSNVNSTKELIIEDVMKNTTANMSDAENHSVLLVLEINNNVTFP